MCGFITGATGFIGSGIVQELINAGDLDGTQLDRFEALLDCADTDLFDWIFGSSAPPPENDDDVMRLLRDFRK
jgi:succinate dehydrogenase flavin-adding protein (antitoxin of CptAB toxin-antitoxin module)